MLKRIAAVGFALVLLTRTAPAETVTLKPEQLPQALAERNQAVRGAALMAESAAQKTGYLVRSYIPSLGLELGVENFQTGSYATLTQPHGLAELRWNLFRGGRDWLEGKVRDAQSRAALAQSKRTHAVELADARRTYWNLVYEREQIGTLKSALAENTQNLAAANRRIQRGLATDTDRLDFEIQDSQLKEDIESLTHRTKQTQIILRSLLVLADDVEVKTIDRIPHEHDEDLLSAKLEANSQPDVAYLNASSEVAQGERSQQARWWLPSVEAYGGYYLYTLRDRDYLDYERRDDRVVGIRMTLTPFDGFQSSNSAKAAALQAEAIENQALQQTRDTYARFRVAQEDMKHEHELTHEAERRIEQGKAYLTRTLAEYDRGVKNAPDVLNASQRLLGFRRRYSEIRKNYQFARTELLAILGK